MVLPLIGVVVPDAAGPAEVAALLEACDRAFLEGACQRSPERPEAPASELSASIEWLSPTEARVTIARSRDASSDSEEVSFVEQDEGVERYRALGFAIGSLGSAFVADVEPEPPLEEAAPLLTAPEPEPQRHVDPPDPIPDRPSAPSAPLPPALSRFQLELGFVGGTGLEQPRVGGELAVWIPVVGRWASHWTGSLTTQQRTAEGVVADFFTASLGFGPRFMAGDSIVAVVAGVHIEQLRVGLGEAELTRRTPATGPFVAAHGRLLSSRFAPFLTLRAGTMPATPIVLQGLDEQGQPSTETRLATHGPLQLDVVLGMSLSF